MDACSDAVCLYKCVLCSSFVPLHFYAHYQNQPFDLVFIVRSDEINRSDGDDDEVFLKVVPKVFRLSFIFLFGVFMYQYIVISMAVHFFVCFLLADY